MLSRQAFCRCHMVRACGLRVLTRVRTRGEVLNYLGVTYPCSKWFLSVVSQRFFEENEWNGLDISV